MESPSAGQLLERLRARPSGSELLDALRGVDQCVYLVGGAVRDLLLGLEPKDVDLAVEGPLDAVTVALGGEAEAHQRFTTATLMRDGRRYDLAQTRAESYSHPGALPEVSPVTIDADLDRRDFTVNAIALGLTGPRAGELVSPTAALADLEARQLAVLHDASFTDDPTRLLRLARYASRLNFQIADHTRALAAAAVSAGALSTVSGARIGSELRLLMTEPDPISALGLLHDLGLDHAIDPTLSFDADRATLAHTALALLPSDGRPDLLVLAISLLNTTKTHTSELLDLLEFNAAEREAITEAATGASDLAACAQAARTGAQVAHAVGSAGVETVALASALVSPEPLQRWLTDLRHRTLEITGADLLEHDIPAGPAIGQALTAARDAMLNDQAPDRERQLEVALRSAR